MSKCLRSAILDRSFSTFSRKEVEAVNTRKRKRTNYLERTVRNFIRYSDQILDAFQGRNNKKNRGLESNWAWVGLNKRRQRKFSILGKRETINVICREERRTEELLLDGPEEEIRADV